MSAIKVHMSNTGNLQGQKILERVRRIYDELYSKPLSTSFNISLKMQNSKRGNVQVVYFSTKGVSQDIFSNPFDMVMQHDLLLK